MASCAVSVPFRRNRIRRPPERCVGHTPDCLSGIEVAQVLAAIDETLRLGKR